MAAPAFAGGTTSLSEAAAVATAAVATPPPSAPVTPMPPAVGATGTGAVVLEKKQFAIAGGLLALLFVAVVALAILVLRRPVTTIVQAPASQPSPAPAPAAASTPSDAPATTEATAGSPPATGATGTPSRQPVEVSEPEIRVAPPVAVTPPPAVDSNAGNAAGRGAPPASAEVVLEPFSARDDAPGEAQLPDRMGEERLLLPDRLEQSARRIRTEQPDHEPRQAGPGAHIDERERAGGEVGE